MREYEIVYIFRSNFTPEEIEAKLERYHGLITAGGKGEITALEQWGKRQLAYPIDKQPNGHYVVAQFTADPEVLPEVERVLKLEEDLLRYLIVISEGELPIPGSMQSAMDDRVTPGRGDNDDEKKPEPATEKAEESAGEAEGEEAATDAEGEADAAEGDDAADESSDDGDAEATDAEDAGDDSGDDSDDDGSDGEEAAADDGDGDDAEADEAEESEEKED